MRKEQYFPNHLSNQPHDFFIRDDLLKKNTKIDIYFLALKKKLPDSSLISIEDDQKNQGTLCMT
tara:strand:- start:1460 stop:1651 length:192 start_codon:yes stop_codon:yes gene_type:complete